MSERLQMRIGGMRWTVRVVGRGRPVLFLHGFTGSGLSWTGIAGLGGRCRAIVPDLPGHGGTGWEADADPAPGEAGGAAAVPDHRPRASVERTADDLAAIVRRLGADRVDAVGYSMGARIALRLAVTHPDVVRRLVLEAPSAGIAEPDARAQRIAADVEWARVAVSEGIDTFAARWEAQPVLAGEAGLASEARGRHAAIRRSQAPLGLAASLVHGGQGAMEPLHERLSTIVAPTLVVIGDRDPARARGEEVAAGIPGARLALVEGAGHAPHVERPERFGTLVLDFLMETAA